MNFSNSHKRIRFIVLLITIAMCLTSCSKDDKEDSESDNADYSGHPIVGTWFTGNISGGRYNSVSGRYEGTTGIGNVYYFTANGTFSELIVFNTLTYTWVASISGKYTIKNNVITFTRQISEDSSNNGVTWSAKKSLADKSNYFEFGTDVLGKYVLFGLDNAKPPLDPETNAAKYWLSN